MKLRRVLGGRLLPAALFLLIFFGTAVLLAVFCPKLLPPLAIGERALALVLALLLSASRIPAERKILRLTLLFFPWVGLAFALPLPNEKPLPPRAEAHSLSDPLMNVVSEISLLGCGLGGCNSSGAEYFSTGKEMQQRLLFDLSRAEKEILLDFYLLERGAFFDSVLNILEEKAHCGVDVNLIYDDFGCSLTLPKNFKEELLKRGVKTTVFHPIRPFPLSFLNRRDHRKLIVIDRKIAYTGGINLADEYIGEKIRFGHWKDCAVRLTGEPAERFSALFHGRVQTVTESKGSPCVVFGDKVRRGMRTGEEIFFKIITSAKEKLYLCTPYLSPTEKVLSAIKSAALSKVEIKVLIPHVPDKKWVFALTRAYGRELEKAGVEVCEYSAGFLHAKTLLCDGEYTLLGSYNLDGRSLVCQAECGVFLKDRALFQRVEEDFLSCFSLGVPLKKATFKEKFASFWMRLFSPLV